MLGITLIDHKICRWVRQTTEAIEFVEHLAAKLEWKFADHNARPLQQWMQLCQSKLVFIRMLKKQMKIANDIARCYKKTWMTSTEKNSTEWTKLEKNERVLQTEIPDDRI